MGVNVGLSHRGRNLGWMVLENKVLRKIFGPKGDEVGGGGGRKLHAEDLRGV